MNRTGIHNQTRSRQKGMTTLGFLILVSFIGLFAFAGIRLHARLPQLRQGCRRTRRCL